uniref:Jupiter microtubule associated homolog 1 n=2 Tax=Macaca TaxID=9539 RepID=A0A5F7ZZF0_MACMU
MTTTTTFKGVDPNSRNSSRVLRPPGGGSNFSLGFDEPTEQPVRKNKMASNIFGTPEENQASWAKSAVQPRVGLALTVLNAVVLSVFSMLVNCTT